MASDRFKNRISNSHGLKNWNQAKAKFTDKIEEKLTSYVLQNSECVVRTARVAPKDVNESAREL